MYTSRASDGRGRDQIQIDEIETAESMNRN